MKQALDVKYDGLLEFLRTRRKLEAGWEETLPAVRAKIEEAAKELPDAPQFSGVKSPEFTYLDCLDTFEALKKLDGEELNLFRQYKQPRVQTWHKLITLYRRNGCHLAELATQLSQNTTYEIPALKAQISRLKARVNELGAQAQAHDQKSQSQMRAFHSQCSELKIQPSGQTLASVRASIQALDGELKSLFGDVINQTKAQGFTQILNHYSKFSQNVHGLAIDIPSRFPVVSFLRTQQDTTVAGLVRAVMGSTALLKQQSSSPTTQKPQAPATGALANAVAVSGIQWDDEDDTPEQTTPVMGDSAIQWDDDEDLGESTVATGQATNIDWTLEIEDLTASVVGQAVGDDWVSVEPQGGSVESSAAIVDATITPTHDTPLFKSLITGIETEDPTVPMLFASNIRMQFICEVKELLAFETMRSLVDSQSDDELGIRITQKCAKVEGEGSIKANMSYLQGIIDVFKAQRTQQLLLIHTSPKFVERMAATAIRFVNSSSHQAHAAQISRSRQAETQREVDTLLPSVPALIQKVLSLKTRLEQELSKEFAGTPIFIVGAINELSA